MLYSMVVALLTTLPLANSASVRSLSSCLDNLHFAVQNLTYSSSIIYTTPAHSNAHARVSFTLVNTQVGLSFCEASSPGWSDADFFSGDIPRSCGVPAPNPQDIATTFTYLRPKRSMQVKQSWTCGGNKFISDLTVAVNIDCSSVEWQNPDWRWPNAGGAPYKTIMVTCKPINVESTQASTVEG
ncbi:hypothetical protein BU24DRAFT_192797 [Aaosphaeria arxii CBS 175.79]|uniref:AA1-like domain-containing protein n=1 Tax=Aaosphaeria arxii CBS 175.79 TaxID=1450172 RepID=A0A6A5XTN0_9PLEO|nr:uncharacterized protein BU24DRAFT_192797 [Aaosphaeria arxii CBS 175.79]KAF2016071.1 hypothetical protein BU24DRAFT_192797 [Aaosphaeria arxii CBS 175.79]